MTGYYPVNIHHDLGTGFMLGIHLPLMLKRLGVNCVFDVGANVGQYGKMLRQSGYAGHIFSFEPVNSTYQQLLNAAANDPLWHTFKYALGSEEGEKQINVSTRSDLSSFFQPTELCGELFPEGLTGSEKVAVRRLDSVFDDLLSSVPNHRVFMKVDTQGFDLEVIAGAKECIKHIVGLQAELALQHIYQNAPSCSESLKVYADLGFAVKNIYTVYEDKNRGGIEFDCLMIRPA